jgi:Dolichyl-phosphate-mannose-protein mannosyltransferase
MILERLPTRPPFTLSGVILLGVIARLALGATIGLGVDESYAVAVARPLSLSYYDHPPLVFWMAAAATRVFGDAHDVLLRLPFVVLFAATTWLLYCLTRRLFDECAALIAAVLAQVIPVFGVSDGGWILPDGPLLLGFSAAALCLAHIALDTPEAERRGWWLGLGLAGGFAALSKYHAAFLFVGTLVFLLTSPRHRRWLSRPEPYVAAAIAVTLALPVLVWNARHGWASFRFQGSRAGTHLGWSSLTALAQNLAGQAGYLLPWVWIPLVCLFARAIRRGPVDAPRWLLVCLGGGPVLVFTVAALGGRPGLPHWPAPGFFLLLPLLADALARRPRLTRVYLSASAAIVLLLVGFAASQIRTGWFSDRFPTLFRRGDPSLEAVDWVEVRTALPRFGAAKFLVVSSWIDGAKLGASLAPNATVLCFNDDARQFRYVLDQHTLIGSDALLVLRGERLTDAQRALRRITPYFEATDSAGIIDVRRDGRVAVRLLVYRATGLLRPYGE